MKLHLAETFTSIQGEGHLVGNRTHFIRFAGCTVTTCPLHPSNTNLCDTNWSPQSSVRGQEGIEKLADIALDEVGAGGWVSITGGEPSDQPEAMYMLAAELRRKGMQLQIQTAGTKNILCPWDWLTVSPKGSRKQITQDYGQELKIIYDGQSLDELKEWYETTKFWFYYLQPTWVGDSCNMTETIDAVHEAYEAGIRFGLSTQMHKWAGVR
jgi:organic radical activating enzyme